MSGPLFLLGSRMAKRNNLNAFAWLCALVLPAGLQWFAGAQPDVRSYIDAYYGPFTLYFFFVMTYGFATVFVSFYQLSSYRRAGTLDLLRITRATPGQVLREVFLQLQRILLPPIAGFALAFAVYLLLSRDHGQLAGMGVVAIASGLINLVLTEMLLCSIVCLGLLRAEALLALLAALLVMPLNLAPVIAYFVSERMQGRWYAASPWLIYAGVMLIILATVLAVALNRLRKLWPPQLRPTR